MKEFKAFLKRVIDTHGSKEVDSLAKLLAEISLRYGDWVGSEGPMDYYLMKPQKEKVKIFEKWLNDFFIKEKQKATQCS